MQKTQIVGIYTSQFCRSVPLLKYSSGRLSFVPVDSKPCVCLDLHSNSLVKYDPEMLNSVIPSHVEGKLTTMELDRTKMYSFADWFRYCRILFLKQELPSFEQDIEADICLLMIAYKKAVGKNIRDVTINNVFRRLIKETLIPESLAVPLISKYILRGYSLKVKDLDSVIRDFEKHKSENFPSIQRELRLTVCLDCHSYNPLSFGDHHNPNTTFISDEATCENCGSHKLVPSEILVPLHPDPQFVENLTDAFNAVFITHDEDDGDFDGD